MHSNWNIWFEKKLICGAMLVIYSNEAGMVIVPAVLANLPVEVYLSTPSRVCAQTMPCAADPPRRALQVRVNSKKRFICKNSRSPARMHDLRQCWNWNTKGKRNKARCAWRFEAHTVKFLQKLSPLEFAHRVRRDWKQIFFASDSEAWNKNSREIPVETT